MTDHEHSWAPLRNPMSGALVQRCTQCDARHAQGTGVTVEADGKIVPFVPRLEERR